MILKIMINDIKNIKTDTTTIDKQKNFLLKILIWKIEITHIMK